MRDIEFQVALGAYLGALFNLSPMLDRDGYHILIDVVRQPNLRAKARLWLSARRPPRRRRRFRGPWPSSASVMSPFAGGPAGSGETTTNSSIAPASGAASSAICVSGLSSLDPVTGSGPCSLSVSTVRRSWRAAFSARRRSRGSSVMSGGGMGVLMMASQANSMPGVLPFERPLNLFIEGPSPDARTQEASGTSVQHTSSARLAAPRGAV